MGGWPGLGARDLSFPSPPSQILAPPQVPLCETIISFSTLRFCPKLFAEHGSWGPEFRSFTLRSKARDLCHVKAG